MTDHATVKTLGIGTVALLVLAGLLSPSVNPASAAAQASPSAPPKAAAKATGAGSLSDPVLRELAAGDGSAALDGRATLRTYGSTRTVAVEMDPTGGMSAAKAAVTRAGGVVTGQVDGQLLAANVPVANLDDLEADRAVSALRVPSTSSTSDGHRPGQGPGAAPRVSASPGQSVTTVNDKLRTRAWHKQQWKGREVRVGIIDDFDGATWKRVAATGALPKKPSATYCRNAGATCNVFTRGNTHGVAVAERIRSIAPSTKLYLAYANTAADLSAAVTWFDRQGVDIISRSEGAELDGDGFGNGDRSAVAARAVARGMLFVNSAGNFAGKVGDPTAPGGYFRSGWVDTDGDGWMNFPDGGEFMRFACYAFVPGLRWDDWGPAATRTDYDVYVYDEPGVGLLNGTSGEAYQQRGARPIERVGCGNSNDPTEYIAIKLAAVGNGTSNDTIEMFSFGGLQYWQNYYSATQAVTDSNVNGVLAVGAITPPTGTAIAGLSAWGPTNAGRLKPDLAASSGWYSRALNGPFAGTSGAAPAVSGAAALLYEAFPSTSPAGASTWLRTYATVDRGAAGLDYAFGAGELVMPTPYSRPKMTKKPKPKVSSRGKKTAKVKVSWKGKDPNGLVRYEVWRSTNRGDWKRVKTKSKLSTSVTVKVKYKKTVRFAVRVKDRQGVWSLFSYSKYLKVKR